MTQAERDRLVALKKAKKKLITQKQAAEEIGITERWNSELSPCFPTRCTGDSGRRWPASICTSCTGLR